MNATSLQTATIQTATAGPSKSRLWASRVVSAVPSLFFLVDGSMKLFKPAVVVETTLKLGYPESSIAAIGVVLLSCTILYLIPRTAVLGAVLLTAYLGGAVATHVRVSGPLFNIVFPVTLCVFVWGGLWLRNSNLRRLLPLIDASAR